MLNLKLAEAYVDLVLQTRKYFTDLRVVQASLARMPVSHTVTLNVNRGAASSSLGLFMQQLRQAQSLAKINVQVNRPAGISMRALMGGGGGAGGLGSGGFIQGLGMGAGMPLTTSPQMMAGMMLGGGAIGAVKTAVQLEGEFATLRRITGLTSDQMDRFKATIMDMANTRPGVSTQDLLEISQIGGRMGVVDRGGVGGLKDFTEQLARVKLVVSDIDTETLANNIGRVLNVFDLGTDRVAGFGSALTAMDNISTASARDLLDITQRLSGTAKAIGMTLPQVVALSSVLKDVGLSNEVAGSSFSQILRKMATDSEKFAKQIGIDAEAFANAYRRDPMEALGLVIGKFKEMKDSIGGQEFLESLGLRGVRVTSSLQQLASKFDEVARRAKIASAETGTTAALGGAEGIMGATTGTAFQRTKNSITDLADAVGTHLSPAARVAANALADVAGGLASVVRGTNVVSFAGGAGGAPKAPLGALPAVRPGGAPVRTADEAQKAVEEAQARAMRAEESVAAKDVTARRLGFEARRAMAGAGGDAGKFAAAVALFGGVEAAEKDAAAAADEMKAAGDALRDAMQQLSELRGEEGDKAGAIRRENLVPNLLAQGQGRLGNALLALGGMKQGLLGAGAKGVNLLPGMKDFGEKVTPRFAAGLGGEDIGRRIQEDILNMGNRLAEETAKNTGAAKGILAEIRDILQRGAGQVQAAVLGQ